MNKTRIAIFYFIIESIFQMSTTASAKMNKFTKENPFTAEMFSELPLQLNPQKVGSTTQYVFLNHIVRTPLVFNKDLQVEGDLLDSWEADDSKRKFKLYFKKNLKFSDGSIINANTFIRTINWQKEINKTIHFDFGKIKEIKLINNYIVEIILTESISNFLQILTHPEFGIYPNLKNDLSILDFKISSGPYYVENFDGKVILMRKNRYYKTNINYPEWVSWQSSNLVEQVNGLSNNKVDFSIPHIAFSQANHDKVVSNKEIKYFDSNIGFTFYLSINPESKIFADPKYRAAIITDLIELKEKELTSNAMWEKANQLYLKGGLGRPSDSTVNKIWKDFKKIKYLPITDEISLLISSKFIYKNNLINFLKLKGYKLNIKYYDNFDEYFNLIKSASFDLVQVNNDFSSFDLIENLIVSFNENRPLIMTKDKKYLDLLLKAAKLEIPFERGKIVKEIGIDLLKQGLIFPLLHYKKLIYAKKIYSFENWSQVNTDMKIYKIE